MQAFSCPFPSGLHPSCRATVTPCDRPISRHQPTRRAARLRGQQVADVHAVSVRVCVCFKSGLASVLSILYYTGYTTIYTILYSRLEQSSHLDLSGYMLEALLTQVVTKTSRCWTRRSGSWPMPHCVIVFWFRDLEPHISGLRGVG